MRMIQNVLKSGKPHPSWWVSDCGTFHVQEFKYPTRGSSLKKPLTYFRAYYRKSGASIGGEAASLAGVVKIIKEHLTT